MNARRRRSSLASDSDVVAPISPAEALGRLCPLPGRGRLLVVSDFDGTLSALVRDPWSARILPTAQRALRRLAATPWVHVALISGRGVTDLAERARIGGISYRGDHGAQRAEATRGFRVGALRVKREPAPPLVVSMATRLRAEVPSRVPESWLVLEDKGISLTFHFRAAPDIDAARARVMAAVDAIDPDASLARGGGRRAVELRPPAATTKGDALLRLIEEQRPAIVLMIGDDRHDALAFDALGAARAAGRIDGLAIAVAGHRDVTADVAPRADVLLGGPTDAARFLSALAREARARRHG